MRLCCVFAVLVLAGCADAKPLEVAPNRDWVEVVRDEDLKKYAPKDGLVTDAKTFGELWKAWRPKEKAPEIDFKKEFAVITLAGGPNKPGISATLDEGELKIVARQTLIGGKGFGYSIATFDRKGVKTVNGKALPK
jgi:hypothetical protein